MKGVFPEDVDKQPFFEFIQTLKARERKDRTELIDPAEAISQTYGNKAKRR
ncbi:hypothetical protein IV64_GL001726 [Lactiplantibacillus xiangfangensis]|uniref:Uncharacterized protein n=2 Tax=Lactobacillaceae TaxID=33958 RepID=A0A0R2MPP6_9LACO|nr:hypothetical protein IV64_GL001726 [Lactiplantibacillus xiangfangensis]